ncbi:MAG: 6-phosphogluconolactonase [Ferruginibacter sp.]|nr:6-phosphogluconolactonase [Ferruginibacter sp.]
MNKKYIFKDAETVCIAAADYIVELSKKTISKKGKFTIALSGGNTPRKLYELLAQPAYSSLLEWKNIFVFWGDERYVPLSDENNNSHMAFAALLNNIPIPAENIFTVPVNFGPERAAISYEQTLLTFFKESIPAFDLILLGIGTNGHTASLFPFTPILKEKKQLVKEIFIEELGMYRISFTATLINQAHHILFLVTGKEKAAIIQTIFSGVKEGEKYPVLLIKPVKVDPAWYIDEAAASGIKAAT